jgi:phospholipase/lecithinase/hemolysin
VATYAGTNPAPSAGRTAVLFAGGNDFINTAAPNPAQMIANMTGAAATLRGLGITQFLIPTLPDLSRTPRGSPATRPRARRCRSASANTTPGCSRRSGSSHSRPARA